MQTDPTTIKQILALSELGLSSRKIAHITGVSKSTVNNYIAAAALREHFADYVGDRTKAPELQYDPKDVAFNQPTDHLRLNKSRVLTPAAAQAVRAAMKQSSVKKQGPRILVWDCETAPALSYTFGRWKQNIGQDNIVAEGGWIICASYKWLGEDETYLLFDTYDIQNASDDYVVDRLWHLYNEADAVVAHNALGFDHKVLQARCLVNHMEPLPNVKVLDTLVMAKKNFRLPSNKLDSIAELLGIGRKQSTGGIRLWIDTMNGDPEQLEKMLQYCKQDTALLEEVYMRLRTFGTASNFNAANYYDDDKERCNICGSTELEATGRSVFTDVSKFQEIRCSNCGGIHRKRQVLNSKEKRKSLLAAVKI